MKIAIIGGGAAGCFAAANIPARAGCEVHLFERTNKLLQKVKVSGGGRCNVTHYGLEAAEFSERYPRGKNLLRKNLHHFSAQDTEAWFLKRGVPLKAEADGRMFPQTNTSQTIIDCLLAAMQQNKVHIHYQKSVTKIEPVADKFVISFADGSTFFADRVLVSVGGFPKKEQYAWLENLCGSAIAPVPSLFTFNLPAHHILQLQGLAAPATIKIAGTKHKASGPVLVTHWGLSGPAVLRCSAWAARDLADKQYSFQVLINWLDDVSDEALKEQFARLRQTEGKQLVAGKNPFALPKRLWAFITEQSGVAENTRWGDLSANAQNKMMQMLLRHTFDVQGKTTFKEEFVTCGGVPLSEIDASTMQSKRFQGLYFAGEVTDVDGITGGFNFQNAWTGAWIAAQHITTTISS